MYNVNYTTIDLTTIDLHDHRFRFSNDAPSNDRVAQIKRTGLVTPVWLQQTSNGHRILTGFDRIRAAHTAGLQKVPAVVFGADMSYIDLFTLVMQERLERGPLLPTEVALVLQRLRDAGTDDRDILKNFLPVMGFGRNPRILELYSGLEQLEPEWQSLLNTDGLSIELASALLQEKDEDRQAFLELVVAIRLGKNRQREFWGMLRDIARIQNCSLSELLASPTLLSIQDNDKLTQAQKTEQIKALLWQWRYPEYTGTRDRFEAILKDAKLPPNMVVSAPPFFDGENFTVSFNFDSPKVYDQHLERLQRMRETGAIDNILNLVKDE